MKRNRTIAKLVRMLGADDAEALASLAAAKRFMRRHGLDWHDVAAAIEGWLHFVKPIPERPTGPEPGYGNLYLDTRWLNRQTEPELRRSAAKWARAVEVNARASRIAAENAHRCLEAAEARAAAKRAQCKRSATRAA